MKRFITRSICILTAGVICTLAGNASAAPTNGWTEEHGDIGIAFEDGELELHFHFEEGLNGIPPEVEFDPGEVYIRLADATKITTAAPAPFLGTTTGDDVWVLPQSGTVADALGVPFVGLATEELDDTVFSSVDLNLTGFSGPGNFALWQDGFTPTVFFQTNDGISSTDELSLGIGVHDHANYGFTQEGVYEVEITATANFIAGGAPVTDVGNFTFVVGSSTAVPEPGSFAALAATGVVGLISRRRRKS